MWESRTIEEKMKLILMKLLWLFELTFGTALTVTKICKCVVPSFIVMVQPELQILESDFTIFGFQLLQHQNLIQSTKIFVIVFKPPLNGS